MLHLAIHSMANENSDKKKWEYKEEQRKEKVTKSGEVMSDVVVGAFENGNKKFEKHLVVAADREQEDIETYMEEIENYTMPL